MAASTDRRSVGRIDIHLRNEVPLVWGSLRLAPIIVKNVRTNRYTCHTKCSICNFTLFAWQQHLNQYLKQWCRFLRLVMEVAKG